VKLGHVIGCPVALALEPGTGVDALDGAVGEGVFLSASQRYTVLGEVRFMIRKLNAVRSKVTRIEELLPPA
jgi:hypothetical protein